MDEHYEGIYRTARLILLSPAGAEEAARQAFVRAWRFRSAAQAGPGVRLWLLRAVLHSCWRQIRAGAADDSVAAGYPVLASLGTLPADERMVVVLRFWAGLPTAESAGVLGVRPERVTARLEAAMAHLAGAPLAAVIRGGSAQGMVDEASIEALVREAGTGLDVPGEGPALILESLPRRGGRRGEGHRKIGAVVGVAAVAALIVVAVAAVALGSGGSSQRASSGASAPALRPANSGASLGSSAGLGELSSGGGGVTSAAAGASPQPSSSAAATPPGAGAAAGALPDVVPQMPTRVVKTGTIALQVPIGHAGDTLNRISDEAATLQGFVSTSSIQNPGGAGPGMPAPPASGAVTVRVPVGSFEAMVSFVRTLGTPTSVTTSGQDVTNSYVDLQARIASLQAARTQFEQIMARATSIGDILSVESQINDLQTQVEQLQGQLNVLTDQTSYSTLTVNVSEQPKPGVVVRPPRPASGLSQAWDHARNSFVHGVEAVIGASGGVAVFLLFAGLAFLAGRYGWRAVRRRLV